MSKLQSRRDGVRFVAVDDAAQSVPPQPRLLDLVYGVLWPAIVIVVEVGMRLCADAFFDPMPTVWHMLIVSFVPAMNLIVWIRLADASDRERRLLMLGTGAAVMIAGLYSLLFLPLLPIALVGIVFYGLGLLPLAPLAAFISALRLFRQLAGTGAAPRLGHIGAAGIALGMTALVVIEIPMLATRVGVQWASSSNADQRDRGVALLRTFGQSDLLLRLCYGMLTRPAGPIGLLLMTGELAAFDRRPTEMLASQSTARELYYRVHGIAFNQVPAPRANARQRSFLDDFQFDSDHGGSDVGGRIKGLSLTQSRMDGSIDGSDAIAYLEWTFEFRNVSVVDREARLELALPPGAVVSRASLWINGEEKEAAYGGRGEVRAAYQKVAVQQRRDPLLVTTKGADRVLAQAFPVPRNGGTIKFKLGITAPLGILDAKTEQLVLPAIFDRNFAIDGDVVHNIWIESRQQISASNAGHIEIARLSNGGYRASGKLDDRMLTVQRQAITVTPGISADARLARIGDGPAILQRIEARAPTPATTIVVIDGSAQMAGKTDEIIAALAAVPAGTRVGIVIAGEPLVSLPVTAWDKRALGQARAALRTQSFAGGKDNAGALAAALLALERENRARLLWIHGPQPQAFPSSAAGLAQTVARLSRLPALTLYPVAAGPNVVLPDVPWSWSAQLLPHVGSIAADLSGYFANAAAGDTLAIVRDELDPADMSGVATRGSDHIVRLWARDRVLAMMRDAYTTPQRERVRQAAVALAAASRLVTPVSGAVVLETKQQYDENRLSPAAEQSVPTLPEPHEWALIGIAGLALLWLLGEGRSGTRRGPSGRSHSLTGAA